MSVPTPHDPSSDDRPGAAHDAPGRPGTAPAGTAAGGFPEPPGADPGDVSREPSRYAALNTPVGDPDPTEWPDPYDRREDPRGPADEMVFPGDGRFHTPNGATSTSEPHSREDPQAPDANAPERDVMDD